MTPDNQAGAALGGCMAFRHGISSAQGRITGILGAGADFYGTDVTILRWRKARNLPSTGAGERIYAIGDVHGRYDLLRDLLDRIGKHGRGRPHVERVRIILLGDLIDRGPESAQVLRLARAMQQEDPDFTVLAGNHEDVMLQALDGCHDTARMWLKYGGIATMKSFGVEVDEEPDAIADDLAALRSALGEEMAAWLRNLPVMTRSGDYFFCHAGVRPGCPLDEQSREDLLWIRQPFLDDRRSHGAVVVHGHSITDDVDI
ncbi:MAG: hypothetical protein B7Z20_02045, partial [Sphingobium sp. 32-64-5]